MLEFDPLIFSFAEFCAKFREEDCCAGRLCRRFNFRFARITSKKMPCIRNSQSSHHRRAPRHRCARRIKWLRSALVGIFVMITSDGRFGQRTMYTRAVCAGPHVLIQSRSASRSKCMCDINYGVQQALARVHGFPFKSHLSFGRSTTDGQKRRDALSKM